MTAEVGPGRVRAAGRIHRDTGVVADEAAGELDVRIGRLRGDTSLAGISVSRAAESVVQTHRRQAGKSGHFGLALKIGLSPVSLKREGGRWQGKLDISFLSAMKIPRV